MASVNDDATRKNRVNRIHPFLKELSAKKEPKSNKAVLLCLIQDLKDEGNQLFKDGQFSEAARHYKHALFVAQVLEERFYHEVETEFMATLYSNGSLCHLKMDNYQEALQFAENALEVQPHNMKAKYRKAQALQGLKRYSEALKEAQAGAKLQPSIFQPFVAKLEEVVEASRSSNTKSATASATAAVTSSQTVDTSNEWLAGTNALKTEKQRKAVLDKMPRNKKKKKAKTPQPIVAVSSDSDPDKDSDSSYQSEDNSYENSNFDTQQKRKPNGKGPGKAKTKVVQVRASEPDPDVDVLAQRTGFTQVGAAIIKTQKKQTSGMGLDTFGMETSVKVPKLKSQAESISAPRLPPVNISWPLDDGYQFRLVCNVCFVKTGEGYKGYNFIPNFNHRCEKNVLIVRRKGNESLNWIKIRPFPVLMNNQFREFKMCQQFSSAVPCKIGELKCTFPHNKCEMNLWYKELDGDFCYEQFMEDLRKNDIDTSERLAERQSPEKTVQNIPGLNFKTGARQRLSSPAPVEQPAPQQRPSPAVSPPLPSLMSFELNASVPSSKSPKVGLLGHAPHILAPAPHIPTSAPPPLLGSRPPDPPAAQQLNMGTRPPVSSAAQQFNVGSVNNSLSDFDFKILCPTCFVFQGIPGKYSYVPSTHVCEENVLAVRKKNVPNAPWVRVRERTNHREFAGNYVMCHSVTGRDAELCRFGEFQCSFAHNEAEQQIWVLEKTGKFSITDFILKNRNASSTRGYTVHELLKKYGGFFTFVCRTCFYGRPPRISEASPHRPNVCTGEVPHRWDSASILAHVNTATGVMTPIEQRKFSSKSAFFRICKYLQFCSEVATGTCMSAHSVLERDVWMLERDTDISRTQIVQLSWSKSSSPGPEQQKPMPGMGGSRPQQLVPSAPVAQAPPAPDAESSAPKREKVPYTVREFCGSCWAHGTRSLEDGTSNRCVKGHNNFNFKRVFLIVGIYRELRSLPAVIPRNLNFVICRFIQQKSKCQYMGQGPCQFAHSEEERVLWIWMARNKVHKLEDVVKQCLEDAKPAKIIQGDSVVAAAAVRVPTQVRTPTQLQNNAHYCRYCSTQCNSDRQWEEHCASEKHIFNVNSDKDHQWNFRQPPWGQGSNLSICTRHMAAGRCPYSHVADMFNLCKYAHSQEELDEWLERYEWRQMKRSLAKQQNMFSYMEQLLERYNAADSGVTEISETLAGVEVVCNRPLVEFRQEKNATLDWIFSLQTQMTLERVALLHHSARLHFGLQAVDGSKHQIMTGDQCKNVDCGSACYKVNVHFTGGIFGSFSQWVVFDFGKKPVLLRKLNVELGHESVQDKVKDLRQMLSFDRWTGENRQVIPYQYTYDEFTVSMNQRYKEPRSEVAVSQDSVRELNQHNYVHKLHRMLELEEITRHKLISSFNMISSAEVMKTIVTEHHTTMHNRLGELFLRLQLTEDLTEDTGAGKLILTGTRSVLLTRSDFVDKHRVYEGQIERKGKDHIYVSLSPVTVRELKLQAGMTVEVEVQFQLNRHRFISMHYALDALENTDIVFPDITKINPAFNEQHTLKVTSRALNQDQLQAVRHIVAERTGYTPPFIMYGPFGTGKTETLAQAAMLLLKERHDTRILICAQSNSAAELYVVKHLDPFLRRSTNSKNLLLRIMSTERRLTSINEGSLKYCYFTSDKSFFEIPPADVVKRHRIVVTTLEMSLRLTSMNLKGHFTHIFIDEAAQALECETLMPLTMATEKTCVVLAGDHLQTSPKVYSAEARCQNFGMSMLERLFDYYSDYSHQLQKMSVSNPLNIFLSINYRTKMEILRFISAVFYGGPEKLTAGGSIPSVVELTPLQFYAVLGKEKQEANCTSFINMAECSEVVERVITLLDEWPREWGRVAPEEIGIITPYHDQVKQIRSALRRHQRADLRLIPVETVQNIQGKEFRALFISPVRTRHLLESKHVAKALIEAEALGGVTDFAFLSDRKLLNTALTRTKSMVAVIGDPLALCAIGECIQIWRTFLKHCNNMRSIRPPNMSYDNIKSQVVELQMLPMGHRLKEVTELFKNPSPSTGPINCASSSSATGVELVGVAGDFRSHSGVPVDDVGLSLGAGDAAAMAANSPRPFVDSFISSSSAPEHITPLTTTTTLLSAPVTTFATNSSTVFTTNSSLFPPAPLKPAFKPAPLKPLGKMKLTKPVIEEFKTTDFPINADEILLQLALESLGGGRPLEPLKVECISVVLEEGQAMVTYNQKMANEEKRRKLLQAAASGKEFASDAEIYADQDEDTGVVTKYYNYTEQTLQSGLHSEPDRFKQCIIHTKNDNFVAVVVNPHDTVQEIEVNGVLHRGRAFDKDEVVVEVMPAPAAEPSKRVEAVQGRVVGILQRAVDHRFRSFVCVADNINTSLLTPITPGTPCIHNITLQKHLQHVKKGSVCVFRLGADNTLSFSHYENVEAKDAKNKLFVVRYLKWLPGFFNPLGVVVGVIPVSNNLSSAQKIVDIEHHLPLDFNRQVTEEVQSCFNSSTLPAEVYSTRTNLAHAWSFTIDSPQATDLQVAFSIDQATDTSYQVAVHITDVAHFVELGSAVDKEALQRGVSLLPIGRDPVPMLPRKLSNELCSLQPGQDRCALSVFMTVAGTGEEWHVVQTSIQPTVINSKQCFSYQDVDNILDDIEGAENDYLKSCVLVLFQIALMQRKQRMGNGHLNPELGPFEMLAPRGHQMVQELLVMANHHVARQLLKIFPQCTPLLQQAKPSRQKLEAWKSQHAADAINSVALTKPFLEGDKVCTCRVVCMCVFGYMRDQEVERRDHFDILTKVWKEMVAAAPLGLASVILKAVSSPLNHPQSILALQELHRILPTQQLVCSGDVDPLHQGHYSLNLPCITDMTSPLRSYTSIIVQRLVWAMISDQASPYAQPDITGLVRAGNYSQRRADSFASADFKVALAAALQSHPITLLPVVDRLDEKTVRLCFPNMPCIPDRDVSLTTLSPCALPLVSSQAQQVKLTWQSRIYDTSAAKGNRFPSRQHSGVELCADRFVSHIPPFQWQQLLAAVREDDEEKQVTTVHSVQGHVSEPLSDGHFALDVSSEGGGGGVMQHFTEYSMSLHTNMMLQVQVTAGMSRYLLTPQIQLISLTPSLDVCMEHRSNPSSCFAKAGGCLAISNTYLDENSYQQHFMPLLALEAAESAVCNKESTTIHNVTIRWNESSSTYTGGEADVFGQFSLTHSFCKERNLFTGSQTHEDLELFGLEKSMPVPMDLLCVRYKSLEVAGNRKLDERVSALMQMGSPGSWVAHCVVLQVSCEDHRMVNVRLRLLSSVKMPAQLLDSLQASQLTCTVECIPKTNLFRQMEFSVACLKSASRLARDVAVGRKPASNIDQSSVAFLMGRVEGLLNSEQKEAVQMALTQPFTVIEGPPGSGKTLMAGHLACLFAQRNRMLAQPASTEMARTQVLVCAASEVVLDVLSACMRSQAQVCPRVVRIYDQQTEDQQYPVPRSTIPPSKLQVASISNPELQGSGLHHIIRSPSSRYYQQIKDYDSLFGLSPQSITDSQVEEYRNLVFQAELEELRQAEVILATCSTAASPKMAKAANVIQVIVDSCESCMEPEALLPVILNRSIQQLVLLGDRQQLTPTVMNHTARSLGLGRSLLERYANTAIPLTKQYRMTQGITEVPSVCFYNDYLRPSELGPGSAAKSLVFSHIMGREKVQMAATDTGVMESLCNVKEAESVVHFVEDLVQKGVTDSRILVLTQYAAQVFLIKQHLTLRHLNNVTVNTVNQCQGCEYDFVIFSTCRSIPRSEIHKMPSDAWLHSHLGVSGDAHQMNVAFTRAKEVLIVTGNKYLLQCHPLWKKLLDHCRKERSVITGIDAADM